MRITPSLFLLAAFLSTPVARAQNAAPAPPLAPLPPGSDAPLPPPPTATTANPAPGLASGSEAASSPGLVDAPVTPPPPILPPPPRAFRRLRHDGFYLAAGTGAGLVGIWGHGPNGDASLSGFGSTTNFSIGGSLMPGLALTAVIEGGTRSGTFNGGPVVTATTTHVTNGNTVNSTGTITGHASATTFLLGLQIDWFPHPDDGWHAGAAIGLGGASVTDDANNTSGGVGLGAAIFGGYQWWLGPSWSLGLRAVASGTPQLKMNDSNQDDTGYRLTPFTLSLQSDLLYY